MNFAKHWAATLDDYAIDLAWSPDGSLLAAASAAGGITLYDAATGAVKHTLPGHADGANCLAWMPAVGRVVPDEPRSPSARPEDSPHLLASGGQDGCVRLWNPATGAQIAETKLGTAWVEHLAWLAPGNLQPPTSNIQRIFAAAGKKLVALNSDGSIAHTFPAAPKTIAALAAAPSLNSQPSTLNSPLLASACFGHVSLWNAATFALEKEFAYGNAIYALAWSPDRRWLVAGCHDNAVHLWAPADDLELHMSGYETRLKELSFSHDSKWLATGGGRDACVWDCSGAGPEGREPMMLPHNARVVAVAFQNAHGLLASGSAEGEFSLWAPSRKNPLFAEVKMPSAATKFAWRADDALLAVGTANGHVFVFKTD
ncbi:MAG: WD40 repeat domain-containing protein [Opitutae bacterium]|nr:WD40 repeat domain-containing protein [Opitutae bacterium]